ncbi:MAG TPA: hypothetical protein VOB72_02640 [Candidatus Dormibacteraeota bacterium]|nr:hypothetical protein [Candidatus Dormibacteraeota bacterium]
MAMALGAGRGLAEGRGVAVRAAAAEGRAAGRLATGVAGSWMIATE